MKQINLFQKSEFQLKEKTCLRSKFIYISGHWFSCIVGQSPFKKNNIFMLSDRDFIKKENYYKIIVYCFPCHVHLLSYYVLFLHSTRHNFFQEKITLGSNLFFVVNKIRMNPDENSFTQKSLLLMIQ